MPKSLLAFGVATLSLLAVPGSESAESAPLSPQIPDTASAEEISFAAAAAEVESALNPAPTLLPPARLTIPSINLESPVVGVGINAKGEMDVPSGKTNNVGWYKHGTLPGAIGSAVLDAHVYAAFRNLKYVQPGESIYVVNSDGKTLEFRVRDALVYRLEDLSPDLLFNRADAKRLNLITCAGRFVPRMGTYDHRLVVFAELVE